MPLLTPALIARTLKNNPKIDGVDYDEPDTAIVYLADGWTWCANDGNRSVEGFYLKSHDHADSLEYFKERLAWIEPIAD